MKVNSKLSHIFVVFFGLYFFSFSDNVSDSDEWIKIVKNSKYLQQENKISEIQEKDLSQLWLSKYRSQTLGFIGNNYKRLRIYFLSVKQNEPNKYCVYGKSNVNGNICSFTGELVLKEAFQFKISDVDSLTQGVLIGTYKLTEDKECDWPGCFSGIFTTNFYIDNAGNIHYDDLSKGADGFKNNCFIGKWLNNANGKIKNSNWGDFRIPLSGDLDIGVSAFTPNPKYLKYGWKEFAEMPIDSMTDLKIPEKPWW